MQVASILWPDIKLQKLSEHRFRLRWTKSGSRAQLRQAKTDLDQHGSDKEAQDSLLDEVGSGWRPWAVGQPPWSADQACGPHRLNQATCRLLIGPLSRLQGSHAMAPCCKYKAGVEMKTHTHITLLSCSLLLSL